MPKNLGCVISYKNNAGIVLLYPKTISSQVLGWNIGKTYGPFSVVLKQTGWQNNQQTISLDEVLDTDIVYCTKDFDNTLPENNEQNKAFAQLKTNNGVQSNNGSIVFNCIEVPQTDIHLIVGWNR